jgi:hypothetical protein
MSKAEQKFVEEFLTLRIKMTGCHSYKDSLSFRKLWVEGGVGWGVKAIPSIAFSNRK